MGRISRAELLRRKKISETMKAKKINVGSKNPSFGKVGFWTGKKRPNNSGENHPLFGVKRPQLSKARRGEGNPAWKGGLPKCVECGTGLKHRSAKRCVPCNNLRKNNWPDRSKHKYKGFCFRSSWEKLLAEKLDKLSILWIYEARTFDLGKRKTYTPDFYLVQSGTYLEVKGRWTVIGRFKYRKFKRLYPHCRVLLLDSKEKVLNYG